MKLVFVVKATASADWLAIIVIILNTHKLEESMKYLVVTATKVVDTQMEIITSAFTMKKLWIILPKNYEIVFQKVYLFSCFHCISLFL